MATGLTYPIKDGTVTSFREFASRFVAPSELVVSDYHYRWVDNAEGDLGRLRALSTEQCEIESEHEHQRLREAYDAAIASNQLERSRYEAMLSKVQGWQPPTPDHDKVKVFMLRELRDSFEFDCSDTRIGDPPARLSGAEWQRRAIEKASEWLTRTRNMLREEEERVAKQNLYNQQLRDSIAAYEE